MASDRRTLYLTSGAVLLLLFATLLIPGSVTRQVLALLLIPCAFVIAFFNKKRSLLSVHKREVAVVMAVVGVIYLLAYYLSGLYFGYAKNYYKLSLSGVYRFILPITVAIICAEIIRQVMIAQKVKKVSVMAYVACVIVDVVLSAKLQNIDNFDVFMNLMGITVFPSIVSNLLYHYMSARYGALPNIVYRLITTLYLYIFPILPGAPEYLMSFVGMLLPIVIYSLMRTMYERRVYAVSYKSQRVSKTFVVVAVLLMAGWVMLVSCQFRFGLIVIGTESMTGEIDKGDAVLFEEYRDQPIREGQVIIFKKDNNMRIIHRVVEIKVIDGETRYYTKGDANESRDSGYITESQIVGVTHFKIKYIGYPTLWLRAAFDK